MNRRIIILGNSGAGKTTLAGQLSRKLAIPHIELDALHWEPDWVEAPPAVFRARVELALQADSWVVDGNYSAVRDLVWRRAHLVVWLDYSRGTIMWRLLRRSLRRIIKREELWNGNRESFRVTFLSRDSVLWWSWTSYSRRKRDYPLFFQQPEYAHLSVVRHHSPRQTDKWLAEQV